MTEENVVREPFAKELRRRTDRKRIASQSVRNLTVPIALSSPNVYAIMLQAYYSIFVAFEEEFEKRRRVYPRLNTVYFRQLLRAKAFARDLAYFSVTQTPTLSATTCFIRDMRQALAREPALIIAYSYALYMGLVVMSPRVMPWARRVFELKGDDGIAVWDFKQTIHSLPGFRKAYDQALNAFMLDEGLEDRIVDEVHKIFERSSAILAEVRSSTQYSNAVWRTTLRAVVGVSVFCAIAFVWIDAFKWAIMTMLIPPDV